MGIGLARLVALGLGALGVGAIAAPRSSSRGYGLPSADRNALAFIRAMGARDLALGIVVAAAARRQTRAALAATLAASALVAAADLSLVVRSDAPEAKQASFVHGGGLVALVLLWAIVRSGR